MAIIVKESDWKREGTFIKVLIEFIQQKRSDTTIIDLVTHLREMNYSKEVSLSEADIFLFYCKLIEAKRHLIIDNLSLLEELVEFPDEYIYVCAESKQYFKPVFLPLLAFCLYHSVSWEHIVYIQQHRKIQNALNIKIELKRHNWNNEFLKVAFSSRYPEIFKSYEAYLMMGDVFVDFVNNQDNWDDKVRTIYKNYPEQVYQYLEFMGRQFLLAVQGCPNDTEFKMEEISKSKQHWLKTYAKALRNMTEKVIDAINVKRSLSKEEKHDWICKVSQSVLLHLNACDQTILKALDDKVEIKLKQFIETLRDNVKKVSSMYTQLYRFNSILDSSKSLPTLAIEQQDKSAP